MSFMKFSLLSHLLSEFEEVSIVSRMSILCLIGTFEIALYSKSQNIHPKYNSGKSF